MIIGKSGVISTGIDRFADDQLGIIGR